MLDRIHFLILPVLLVYGLISSAAIASEASYSLRAQSKLFETTEGPVLMAAEDTVSQERVKAFRSYSATDFELAFQEYFSKPWSLMIYQGFGTSTDLGQTLVLDIKSENSLFTGLVLNRKMFPFWRYFTFELEGQVVRHYKKRGHFEYNGLIMVRFHPFLLDSFVDIEFAVGEGVSYATKTPVVEEEQHPDDTSHFMNYLAFEVALTLPEYREWTLVTRIHHRSGAFGLFNGTRGGSNFLALGLRYNF